MLRLLEQLLDCLKLFCLSLFSCATQLCDHLIVVAHGLPIVEPGEAEVVIRARVRDVAAKDQAVVGTAAAVAASVLAAQLLDVLAQAAGGREVNSESETGLKAAEVVVRGAHVRAAL